MQNCKRCLLFSFFRKGFITFECLWIFPALRCLDNVLLSIFMAKLKVRRFVRWFNGISRNWARSICTPLRPHLLTLLWDITSSYMSLCDIFLKPPYCLSGNKILSATSFITPFSNFPFTLFWISKSYETLRSFMFIFFFDERSDTRSELKSTSLMIFSLIQNNMYT